MKARKKKPINSLQLNPFAPPIKIGTLPAETVLPLTTFCNFLHFSTANYK